jgi:predicted MFS family arabinose efflux permease
VKRSFLFGGNSPVVLVAAGTGLIAATYGLIRLAFGLFLPDVRRELGLGLDAAGLISGGASLVYCLGALAGFLLAARNARGLVLLAMITASAGAVGMAAAPTSAFFAVFAITGSAGAGLASPALVAVVGRNLTERSAPRSQAVVNAGTGPGLVLAGVLALVLLPDWRTAWVIAAVVAVLAGAVVLLADHRNPADTAPARVLPPRSWYAAHARVIAAALLMGFGSAAAWTYTRTVLVDAGAGETISIVAWVALGLGGTVVIVSSRFTDRLEPRLLWAVTAVLVAIASAVIATGTAVPVLVLAAAVVFGWAYTAGSGALIGWTTLIDTERAAAGTALLFVVLILGQAGGAVAAGALVVVGGYPSAFLVAAAVSLAAAAIGVMGRRNRIRVQSPPIAPSPPIA